MTVFNLKKEFYSIELKKKINIKQLSNLMGKLMNGTVW